MLGSGDHEETEDLEFMAAFKRGLNLSSRQVNTGRVLRQEESAKGRAQHLPFGWFWK